MNALVGADLHFGGRGDAAHAIEITVGTDRLFKKSSPQSPMPRTKRERAIDGKALPIGVGRNPEHRAPPCAWPSSAWPSSAWRSSAYQHRHPSCGTASASGGPNPTLELESAVARIPARLRLAQIGRRIFRSNRPRAAYRHAAALFGVEQSDRPAARWRVRPGRGAPCRSRPWRRYCRRVARPWPRRRRAKS